MCVCMYVFIKLHITGSAVPSRVSLLISILRLNLVLTYGIPPEFSSVRSEAYSYKCFPT